jgi:hypothetical protein
MSRGYSGGQADARTADAFVSGLGMAGMPLYFSCDKDFEACSSSAKSTVDSYCDGVKSVIGLARAGGYGDDSFCKRQLDAGRITYAWQTRSWSEGMWEPRACLRQVKFDFAFCGGTIDDDEAWAADYGQWPRPAGGTVPGTDGGILVSSDVAFDPASGKQVIAYIDPDGHVRCNGGLVDPGSNAKSGVGLAISPDGVKVITYTNAGGKVCTYTQDPGSNEWGWSDRGWTAR